MTNTPISPKTNHLSLITLHLLLAANAAFAQGSLTPPGAPAPTMKTLDQVEARTIINATNTPGDGNNLFVINAPGSYYLTGNITGVSGKNGILINASNVTLDLNGFQLIGVGGSLVGIWDGGVAFHGNATVRNGTIRLWGGNAGINLSASSNSLIEDLIVTDNSGAGMKTGYACVVRDCVSSSNGGDGIVTGLYAKVSHCAAWSDGGYGISISGVATDCEAGANTYGIGAGNYSMVSHCSASGNSVGGMFTGTGCTIAGCTVSGNGAGSASGFGISAGNGSCVTDSNASYNTATYGIVANPGSTLTNCTASFNTSAQSISEGILAAGSTVIGCTAGGNTTTNATPTHTTGMGIYNNGSNATIKNCTVSGNSADGLVVGSNCIVADNQVNNNGRNGIFATAGLNRIEGNHVQSNGASGIGAGATDYVIRNTSSNNSGANFIPTSGTNIAPIQTASTATNPFANLQ